MAICRIIETGATHEQYDRVRAHVGAFRDNPPPAAQAGDWVIEVWDSREQAEDWSEKNVPAARRDVAPEVGEPKITYYEVHNLQTMN